MLTVSFTPFPELKTERLLLRMPKEQDAEQLFLLRSDKISMQFLDKEPLKSLAEAALLIKKITDDVKANNGISWAIALKDDPQILIGTIGYWKITKEHFRAEIGYMLMPAHFKKGLMKEAMNTVIHYGFNTLQLHSIEANINPLNVASAALLKSCSFVQEAYFKENYYFRGKFSDSAIYSLINKKPC